MPRQQHLREGHAGGCLVDGMKHGQALLQLRNCSRASSLAGSGGINQHKLCRGDPSIEITARIERRWPLSAGGRCEARTPTGVIPAVARAARRANHIKGHLKPIGFVQPSIQKIFSFAFPEIMIYSSASRADTRGVRVVTNVVRNAVDVKGPGDDRL